MNQIILIGLFLSVITVDLKSMQREKAAGNAEQRARQLDQGSLTFESRDENGEEQVQKLQKLQKMLRIRQAVQEANSEPIRAAVQMGREAETKAINETDTKAKASMADYIHPSPDVLRREAVDTRCKDLIPGLKLFQSGVDGTRLDLMSLGEGEDTGFRSPVVYFTCEKGKKTKIPPNTGKKIYDEPDQIDGVAAISAGFSSNKAEVMKTRSDVSKSISANAGIGVPGLFSLSASYSKMTAMVDERKKSLASSKQVVPVFTARMLPFISLQVTPHIKKYIEERLKLTFEEDPAPYREFIRQWGTHLFQKANFGGLIRVLMEMDSSFAEKQTKHTIGVQASGIIKGVELGGGFESADKNMNSDFQKHTSVTKRILGGDYNRFVNEGFKGWQPTVAESPWLYKGRLMSVHRLFKDAKKGKEMLKAIEEHMAKAQLESMLREAKMKLPSLVGDRKKKLQSYIDKCNELKIKDFPKANDVKELNKQIEKAMLWPDCKSDYVFPVVYDGIAGASSYWTSMWSTDLPPENAFQSNSPWCSLAGYPAKIWFKFKFAVKVGKISFSSPSHWKQAPETFNVIASDDCSNWDTLLSVANSGFTGKNQEKSWQIPCTQQKPYRCYGIEGTKNLGHGKAYISLKKLKMFQ